MLATGRSSKKHRWRRPSLGDDNQRYCLHVVTTSRSPSEQICVTGHAKAAIDLSELDLATASSSARWSDGGEQSRFCGPTRTTNDGRTISASSRCSSGGADLGGGSWWVGWAARLAGRERNTTTPFFSHSRRYGREKLRKGFSSASNGPTTIQLGRSSGVAFQCCNSWLGCWVGQKSVLQLEDELLKRRGVMSWALGRKAEAHMQPISIKLDNIIS
uniref:Uncharacterized protein n=1 Tax=Oryza glumipatula TaxID=40148 RepID=A0A0E0BL35_9ORYZ